MFWPGRDEQMSAKPPHPSSPKTGLDLRVETIVSERLRCFAAVSPKSMGSAQLKYGGDGRIAWDQIWTHFCDLALAGGPPHRGRLLEPASPSEIANSAARYEAVIAEVIRGIELATDLKASPSSDGWLAVQCGSIGMASWLQRAIVCENVLAQQHLMSVLLPAGPSFVPEKEIKNVITALAKTTHEWQEHLSSTQREAIESLYRGNERELLEPSPRHESNGLSSVAISIASELRKLGCASDSERYPNWLGIRCGSDRAAGQVVLRLVAGEILARREDATAFIPLHRHFERKGIVDRIVAAAAEAISWVEERRRDCEA